MAALDDLCAGPPRRLATGFGFTEGPLWDEVHGQWLFSDLRTHIVHTLREGGQPRPFRTHSGCTNGLTWDIEGELLLCEADGRRIARRSRDGTYPTVADRVDGRRFNRPNDILCRSDGAIYFSDPAGGMPPESRELATTNIHLIRTDGSVTIVADDMDFPNGLALSPDERTLYAANTYLNEGCLAHKRLGQPCRHQFIKAFDVQADGTLAHGRVFAELHSSAEGVPDGMKVDREGRVFCAGPGGCWVFTASGDLVGIIELPEVPSNCAWGGKDYRTLLVTARTSVFAIAMRTPGIRPPGSRRPLSDAGTGR